MNLRPHGPEPCALPSCATTRWYSKRDSNPHWTASQTVASAVGLLELGTCETIRTSTTHGLNVFPLPVGVRRHAGWSGGNPDSLRATPSGCRHPWSQSRESNPDARITNAVYLRDHRLEGRTIGTPCLKTHLSEAVNSMGGIFLAASRKPGRTTLYRKRDSNPQPLRLERSASASWATAACILSC